MQFKILHILIALVATLSAATTIGANAPVAQSLNYNDILACGPNSLFMFMILSGRTNVDYSELRSLPVSSEGVSLLALRGAAKDIGVETEIRHYSTNDIESVRLPAIGQFYASDYSITALHFDVIYKVDANYVYLLNGTTGSPHLIHRSRLSAWWTGYAMSEVVPAKVPLDQSLILLAGCLMVCNILAFRYLPRKAVRDNKIVFGGELP